MRKAFSKAVIMKNRPKFNVNDLFQGKGKKVNMLYENRETYNHWRTSSTSAHTRRKIAYNCNNEFLLHGQLSPVPYKPEIVCRLKYFPNSEWITVIKKIRILRRHVLIQILKKAKVKQ